MGVWIMGGLDRQSWAFSPPPRPPSPPLPPPQAQLMEVEASLADKRAQLDRVATMLLARQRDLEYEAQRAGLTAEGGSGGGGSGPG